MNIMGRVDIKALSVNKCWQGRRFKTPAYKAYETELLYMLPKKEIPEGKLGISICFGFSSKLADIDNGLKPFIDILQKKYGFDDKMVYSLNVTKIDTKKGEEFITFDIHES